MVVQHWAHYDHKGPVLIRDRGRQERQRPRRCGDGSRVQGLQDAALPALKMEEGHKPQDAGASSSLKRQRHQVEPPEGTNHVDVAICAM